MVSQKVTIKNKTGLHARPAANLTAFVKKYKSKVYLVNGNKKANAASVINVLTLGAKQGTEIEVQCDGDDEAVALKEIVAYIEALEE